MFFLLLLKKIQIRLVKRNKKIKKIELNSEKNSLYPTQDENENCLKEPKKNIPYRPLSVYYW